MKKSEVNRNYIIGQAGKSGVWLIVVKKKIKKCEEFIFFTSADQHWHIIIDNNSIISIKPKFHQEKADFIQSQETVKS